MQAIYEEKIKQLEKEKKVYVEKEVNMWREVLYYILKI